MKKFVKILILSGALSLAAPQIYGQVSVSLTVRTAPPALPVYVQPECPVDGYIWQPGYWAYDDVDGYYWVPGVWVAPPNPGLYWTPAYWGYTGGVYGFHAGYWGPHVGFYGGINYGYGYSGYGYGGGRWEGNRFRYNTAVVRVNRTVIHNTYIDRTVVRKSSDHRSFNGRGGVTARPRPEERSAMNERHVQPTANQVSHQEAAHKDRNSFAKVNHGRPAASHENRAAASRNNVRPNNTRSASRTPVLKSAAAARPVQKQRPEQRAQVARKRAAQPQRALQQRTVQRRVQPQRAPQQRTVQTHVQPRAHVQPQRAPQPHVQPKHAAQPHSAPRPGGGGHHR